MVNASEVDSGVFGKLSSGFCLVSRDVHHVEIRDDFVKVSNIREQNVAPPVGGLFLLWGIMEGPHLKVWGRKRVLYPRKQRQDSDKTSPYPEMVNVSRDETGTI